MMGGAKITYPHAEAEFRRLTAFAGDRGPAFTGLLTRCDYCGTSHPATGGNCLSCGGPMPMRPAPSEDFSRYQRAFRGVVRSTPRTRPSFPGEGTMGSIQFADAR